MKNVLKLLAKSVLIPLGLTAASSATDAAIHKKMFGSSCCRLSDSALHLLNLTSRMTAPIISNEEMNDLMNIVKSLEKSAILIKDVSKKNKNEGKEQNGGFLGMLLGTLRVRLLRNLLTIKGII